jgi:hypothetical protein
MTRAGAAVERGVGLAVVSRAERDKLALAGLEVEDGSEVATSPEL